MTKQHPSLAREDMIVGRAVSDICAALDRAEAAEERAERLRRVVTWFVDEMDRGFMADYSLLRHAIDDYDAARGES